MSFLFRKFIVLIALSVAISGPAMAKATDESDGKTSKLKSGLFSKKSTKEKATKKKSTTKKATTKKAKLKGGISAKKKPVKKLKSGKKSTSSKRVAQSKEQYKNITVNLNKASASALSAYLVGVGPMKAKAIEAYRKKNGKFKSLDDLMKVEGIGEATLAGIKKNVSLSRGETAAPEGFKMGDTKKTLGKKKLGSNTKSRLKKSGSEVTRGKKKSASDDVTGKKSKVRKKLTDSKKKKTSKLKKPVKKTKASKSKKPKTKAKD